MGAVDGMARPRVIDQQTVLDAAEAVVGREGAANLTLEAVAAEAGISKASVLYDYKSKQSLIRAVVERRVRHEEEKMQAAAMCAGEIPDAAILGRISVAAQSRNEVPQAVALSLCSALAQDNELRGRILEFYRGQLASACRASPEPCRARLAFLALEGFRMLEAFGFLRWSEDERKHILRDIAGLVGTDFSPAPS